MGTLLGLKRFYIWMVEYGRKYPYEGGVFIQYVHESTICAMVKVIWKNYRATYCLFFGLVGTLFSGFQRGFISGDAGLNC